MLLVTSDLFAICDQAEPGHVKATEIVDSALRQLTHGYVLAEFVALAHVRRFSRPRTLQCVATLLNSPGVQIIGADAELTTEAVQLLHRRPDKTCSNCDAVSFLLMRQFDIDEALTTDRHFEQEGFIRLLT